MKNKEILKYCTNFYEIINFESADGDNFTPKMISLYRNFIFKKEKLTEDRITEIVNMDKAMKKYIDDYLFRKDMQNCILSIKVSSETKDLLKIIVEKIIDFFINYAHYTTRIVYISKWI